MVSKFGYQGLIAFIAVAVGVFGIIKIPGILEFLKKQLRESKGLTNKLRVILRK